MAVRLAESLIEMDGFDASDVLARYVRWWKEGSFDTGPVADRALEVIAAGSTVADATAQVHSETGGRTAGCNPAHRTPPLAMCAGIADLDLEKCAATEAALTHADPIAGRMASIGVLLCRQLIRGITWNDAFSDAKNKANMAITKPNSPGGFAPDVLHAALYFVDTSTTFADALHRSMTFAGAANYCPILVGAIAGARWGRSAIPVEDLGHVDVMPRVEAAAMKLANSWEK
ncbi:MAG TPA: ADP-ribosylglycohydrolase family protein [Gemmataceae bacterium]|jgi:ADP-ribosylglycohydrolase|nr:ADP-ribosylglycohydrolase family protein [Gemmataceae bacterium]